MQFILVITLRRFQHARQREQLAHSIHQFDFETFLKAKAGFKEVDLEAAGDDYYEVFWSMLEPVFDGICQKNKMKNNDHASIDTLPRTIAHPMSGGNAPGIPPTTVAKGVFLFNGV